MHCGGMTQLVREVRQQKPNTRSFVNERLAAIATGPLFRVSHLETPPTPAFKRAGLKAVCARLGGCVFQMKVEAIRSRPMSAFGGKADITLTCASVCF
jgi:hypothetical protein